MILSHNNAHSAAYNLPYYLFSYHLSPLSTMTIRDESPNRSLFLFKIKFCILVVRINPHRLKKILYPDSLCQKTYSRKYFVWLTFPVIIRKLLLMKTVVPNENMLFGLLSLFEPAFCCKAC